MFYPLICSVAEIDALLNDHAIKESKADMDVTVMHRDGTVYLIYCPESEADWPTC